MDEEQQWWIRDRTEQLGTQQCARGWGDRGCQDRATTDVGAEFLCISHALLEELRNVRTALDEQTEVSSELKDGVVDISDSLSVLPWRVKPWWVRMWCSLRNRRSD